MQTLNTIQSSDIQALEERVRERVKACEHLEAVAQTTVDLLYREYRQSIVLARFYATMAYEKLPAAEAVFAKNLAASKNATAELDSKTPVICLLGSRGDRDEWNNRKSSKNHLAIPLISSLFVDGIPMMAKMLSELGVMSLPASGPGEQVSTQTFGKLGGLFYVEDARSAVDRKQRPIISAQDFVSHYGVKSVFGTAGYYQMGKVFIIIVLFTREIVERALAQSFMPLANMVTGATYTLVQRGTIFAP